jgi:hypothetical protein
MNGGAMADHRQERHEAGPGADQQHWAVIDRPPHEVTSQRPLKLNGVAGQSDMKAAKTLG